MLRIDGLGWFTWLIVGALAGWLATAVMQTKRHHGLIYDVVLGIIGAVVGGLIFTAVRLPVMTGFSVFPVTGLLPAPTGFSAWSILVAFIVGLALLGLLRLFSSILVTRGASLGVNLAEHE